MPESANRRPVTGKNPSGSEAGEPVLALVRLDRSDLISSETLEEEARRATDSRNFVFPVRLYSEPGEMAMSAEYVERRNGGYYVKGTRVSMDSNRVFI